MKKILFITQDFEHGGIPRVLANLLGEIDKQRIFFNLFVCNPVGIFKEQIEKHSTIQYNFLLCLLCCNYRKEKGAKRCLAVIIKIIRYIIIKLFNIDIISYATSRVARQYSNKYDIVWACSEGVAVKIAQKINAHKRFLWVHSNVKYGLQGIKEVGIPNYQKFNKIICVSNDTYNSLKDVALHQFNLDLSSKLTVLYNIVNENEIYIKSKDNIEEDAFHSYNYNILSIVCYFCFQSSHYSC